VCAIVLINLFEVDPDADEPFIADWEEARDFLKWKDGFLRTALHRSLAPDAAFRFVNMAEIASVDAWRALVGDPRFPGREASSPSHPGLYEVLIKDDGVPEDAAVLINAFDVPHDHEEAAFTTPWHEARDHLSSKPGYLGSRLHRCIGAADFRFVNVAWWESAESFGGAVRDPGFGAIAARMPYEGRPGLYEVIRR